MAPDKQRTQGIQLPDWEEVSHLPDEWKLYKDLISAIPEGIAVRDIAIGNHWALVETDDGCGIALASSGGRGSYRLGDAARSMDLRDLAAQTTSWNFLEASVGVAALNAWYSTPEHAAAAGMIIESKTSNDGFDLYRAICAKKRVTVVGHFPLIERLADTCELSILERNPHGDDMPDPACEYLLPHQDAIFITGLTLTNKTMPRLLHLSKNASTILVGPSVVPAPLLFEYGADCLAGSVVVDPEQAKAAILHGFSSGIFDHGVQKMRVERPGWIPTKTKSA